MSIKIYNAFRAQMPFESLHAKLTALRTQVKTRAEALALEALACQFEAQLDDQIIESLFGAAGTRGFDMAWFWPVLDAVRDQVAEVKAKGVRKPDVDFSCSVLVIPSAEGFLGVVYTEQPALAKLVLSTEGFEDWHYQNSTDRPEGVSEAAWALRKASWAAATADFSGTMGAHGFSYDLAPLETPYPSPAAMASRWHTVATRAARVAREAALLEISRELMATQQAAGETPNPMRCVIRASQQVTAPEQAGRVAGWARRIESHIVPVGLAPAA